MSVIHQMLAKVVVVVDFVCACSSPLNLILTMDLTRHSLSPISKFQVGECWYVSPAPCCILS